MGRRNGRELGPGGRLGGGMAAFFILPRLPSSREGGGGEGRVGWATSSIGFGINCWVGLGLGWQQFLLGFHAW
jgi:hypothetical protein